MMDTRQFEFNNSLHSLIPALKQMLDYIQQNLTSYSNSERTLFSSKIILTELLTNSLKHSGIKTTLIHIKLNHPELTIVKTDQGKPLSLITSFKSKGKIPITNDILHTLYAVAETESCVHFMCEENRMEDILEIDDLVEHFGLLIITKAADDFNYTYNRETGLNTFKVNIKLL